MQTTITALLATTALFALSSSLDAQTQTPPTVTPRSIVALGVTDTEDFNSPKLANAATSATTPPGWAFREFAGTAANTFYSANDGSSDTGDTYSFGAAGSTERAFGEITTSAVSSQIGAQFVNNTGSIITSITISYTGEQWRQGSATGDKLEFLYSTDAAVGSITSGTFINFDALDFFAPNSTSATGALDGNAVGNRTSLTATISGLSLAPNDTFTVRWDSINPSFNDDGLAVDDFNLTAIPEPGTYVAGLLGLAAIVFAQRRRISSLMARGA